MATHTAPTPFPPMPLKAAPEPIPGVKTVTRRDGKYQAGTVTVGDLTIFYSYATAIGGMVTGESPIFTDAHYSSRTEAHAARFGMRDKAAIVLADPAFRSALLATCQGRGIPAIPRADFTNPDRDSGMSFPESVFFGNKRERGQHPKPGSYVYVVRDRAHMPGSILSRGYRVKAIYCGIVRADDPATGRTKGQRMIRPAHLGYGEATETVDAAWCETEGGAESFPD